MLINGFGPTIDGKVINCYLKSLFSIEASIKENKLLAPTFQ